MQCFKHPFDRAHDVCRHCGDPYCRPCLVYPMGERKSAFCVACTLARSGVRTRGVGKPLKPREIKHRRRELIASQRTATGSSHFVELAHIPHVPEEDIMAHVRGPSDNVIVWVV